MKARTVLLVSNTVMHYRVSVYNYFHRRFAEEGWDWRVLTNDLASRNSIPPLFPIDIIPFQFSQYRTRIKAIRPDVVILFLHLRDQIQWPLIHWLKLCGIPTAVWTKTRNLDHPGSALRNVFFHYVNSISDGIIVYSPDLMRYLTPRQRSKAFVANNTINHEDFPQVVESVDEIKRSLGIAFGKVVLFAGRMDINSGRKRVDALIDIFRDIDGRDAGLVIVGSGLRPDWKARMNHATSVYLGEVHDPENREIARVFTMADVVSIPGHVGLGLNQAFLFGLPVVTMEGPQPPEIGYLHQGRNGYIVPQDDTRALRARIFQLLDDDRLRATMSANARTDFLREASIEGMFQGFRRCVEMLAATPRGERRE